MEGGERMFVLYADKAQLDVRQREPIASGSENVHQLRFEFSPEWEGLEKTVIFQAGYGESAVALAGGACTIPPEVLKAPGYFLMAGVCGKAGETLVMPTVWANLGLILEGATPPSGSGTLDHRELSNRDAENQHPIGAITGLDRELSKRVSEDDALNVVEIIKIMEG